MGSRLVVGLIAIFSLAACSSAQKQRQIDRDKLVATTGLYCDFINGDEYQDIEVKLNLEIARKCDPAKNYTISSFKNSSDLYGMLYCCSVPKKEDPHSHHDLAKHEDLKHEDAKHDELSILDDKPAVPPKTAAVPAVTPPAAHAPAASPAAAPAPANHAAPASSAVPSTAPAKPAAPSAANSNMQTNRAPASANPVKVKPVTPSKPPIKAPTDSLFDE